MAYKLEDKPNVTAPNADYPYGDIKDNSGSNDGTPVNRLVYADFHQFFAKLADYAGIVFNGVADNFTNGFQYFTALIATIRATYATETERGTAEIATQAECTTGTDDARMVTPLKMKTYVTGYTDISASVTAAAGLTVLSKKVHKYIDGYVTVRVAATFAADITADTVLLSGLPNLETVTDVYIANVYVTDGAAKATAEAALNSVGQFKNFSLIDHPTYTTIVIGFDYKML